MDRWQNKVAVVTGASSGIGEACCKDLVAKGMIVVGLARRLEKMQNDIKATLPKEHQGRFHPVHCDVSQEADIVKSFAWIEKHLGGVDVLVNNAGILRQTQIVSENNGDDLRAVVDTNIMGVALCTREAFRSMKKRAVDGHVVIINSLTGHYLPMVPGVNFNMYPPTKHALTAMTEVLRREFLENNTKIKVTSISPGLVETEIISINKLPTGMAMLRPEDISDAVVYCIQTPPNVQVHEMMIRPIGEKF